MRVALSACFLLPLLFYARVFNAVLLFAQTTMWRFISWSGPSPSNTTKMVAYRHPQFSAVTFATVALALSRFAAKGLAHFSPTSMMIRPASAAMELLNGFVGGFVCQCSFCDSLAVNREEMAFTRTQLVRPDQPVRGLPRGRTDSTHNPISKEAFSYQPCTVSGSHSMYVVEWVLQLDRSFAGVCRLAIGDNACCVSGRFLETNAGPSR